MGNMFFKAIGVLVLLWIFELGVISIFQTPQNRRNNEFRSNIRNNQNTVSEIAQLTSYPEFSQSDTLAHEQMNAAVDDLRLAAGEHAFSIPARVIGDQTAVTPSGRTYTLTVMARNHQDPKGVTTLLVSVPSSFAK